MATSTSAALGTSSGRFSVGEKVFFFHPVHAWILGAVAQVNPPKPGSGGKASYHVTADDDLFCVKHETTAFVDDTRVDFYDPEVDVRPPNDLLHLAHLHDASILRTLARRYFEDVIYTNIGVIVVAVNPFNLSIPRYQDSQMASYVAERGNEIVSSTHAVVVGAASSTSTFLMPHTWAQAHNTYHELTTTKQPQSILISGESGSGKTEAAKAVVKYLAQVSVAGGSAKEQQEARALAETIQACTPILEAFGNAKTARNDNSSRFGKLLDLQFSSSTFLFAAAHATSYLLEKSRVLSCGPGERIFHSFYLAIVHASATFRENTLRLKPTEMSPEAAFKQQLSSGGILQNSEYSKPEDFEAVTNALRFVMRHSPATGATPVDSSVMPDAVWQLVASIIHLSHVSLVPDGEGSKIDDATTPAAAGGSSRRAKAALEDAVMLWLAQTVPADKQSDIAAAAVSAMEKELTSTELVIMGTATRKLLNPTRSADVRDALCKALYHGLFEWLVQRCNEACGGSEWGGATKATVSVALLDIFGFESFTQNNFEQLCINFANETLQQHYNHYVFQRDLDLCRSEGIDTVDLVCPDASKTLALITGVFSALDDQCAINGSESALMDGLVKQFHKKPETPAFLWNPTKRNTFSIAHYAGSVTYVVDGWLEKNRDTFKRVPFSQFFATLRVDENEPMPLAYRVLAPSTQLASDTTGAPSKRGANAPATVASFFRSQMKSLLQLIEQTNPRWVRCVKPHVEKKPRMFSGPYTLAQLECSGILGTVKVRKAGFPVRFQHTVFCVQFAAIARLNDVQTATKESVVAHCKVILKRLHVTMPLSAAQIGKTMVFLKNDAFLELERLRKNAIAEHALHMERAGRGYLRRRRLHEALMAKRLQRFGRAMLSNKKLAETYALVHANRILERRREKAEMERLRAEEARREQLELARLAEKERQKAALFAQTCAAEIAALMDAEAAERQLLEKVREHDIDTNIPSTQRFHPDLGTDLSTVGAWFVCVLRECARRNAMAAFMKKHAVPLEAEYFNRRQVIEDDERHSRQFMYARERPVRIALWLREQLVRTRREEISERAALLAEFDDDVQFLSRVHLAALEQEKYRQLPAATLAPHLVLQQGDPATVSEQQRRPPSTGIDKPDSRIAGSPPSTRSRLPSAAFREGDWVALRDTNEVGRVSFCSPRSKWAVDQTWIYGVRVRLPDGTFASSRWVEDDAILPLHTNHVDRDREELRVSESLERATSQQQTPVRVVSSPGGKKAPAGVPLPVHCTTTATANGGTGAFSQWQAEMSRSLDGPAPRRAAEDKRHFSAWQAWQAKADDF